MMNTIESANTTLEDELIKNEKMQTMADTAKGLAPRAAPAAHAPQASTIPRAQAPLPQSPLPQSPPLQPQQSSSLTPSPPQSPVQQRPQAAPVLQRPQALEPEVRQYQPQRIRIVPGHFLQGPLVNTNKGGKAIGAIKNREQSQPSIVRYKTNQKLPGT